MEKKKLASVIREKNAQHDVMRKTTLKEWEDSMYEEMLKLSHREYENMKEIFVYDKNDYYIFKLKNKRILQVEKPESWENDWALHSKLKEFFMNNGFSISRDNINTFIIDGETDPDVPLIIATID